jgi:type III restriction enzyme
VRKYFGLLLECPCKAEAAASRLSHDRAPPDWDKVGELSLDPGAVPAAAGLIGADGSLIGQAPCSPARLSLNECERGVRLQQVAFNLAKVLAIKWREDRGDGIPSHRLFPRMVDAANRFIDTRVECIGPRQKYELAINPYFGQTCCHAG